LARRFRRSTLRSQQGHVSTDRWLITYADLITLLLIFFVLMYTMSKVDIEKYSALAQALNLQFTGGGSSVLDQGDGLLPGASSNGQVGEEAPTDLEFMAQSRQEQNLQELLGKINQYIEEHDLGTQVTVSDADRGVVIKLSDTILFDLGKADIKPEAIPLLEKLASFFPTLNTKISIEGHTDDLPLATGSFYRDNWGLSQARSVAVLRYFTEVAGLDPRMFVSTAYADTMPLAPNDSDENRAKNRRVEIVILREPVQ